MFVYGLNGSPATEGNTFYLLQSVLEQIKGAKTEIAQVGQIMSAQKCGFCVNCATPCPGQCYKGTALEEVFEKMRMADVILFGSPVYFGGPTAQLKALFDKSRRYRGEKAFVGKYGAALAVGASKYGGQEATVKSLQNSMLVQGMTIIGPGSMEYDAGHLGVCAARPAAEDEFARSRCASLAARIQSLPIEK